MNLTPAVRKRLYETAIAGCAVAVGYGLLSGEEALLWLGLAGAVLGVARNNVNEQ
jgi:hypothetical protein